MLYSQARLLPSLKADVDARKKKRGYWRRDFLPLSDLLCWPAVLEVPATPAAGATEFLIGPGFGITGNVTGAYLIVPSNQIPDDVRGAIDGRVTDEDRRRLVWPRVILSTRITRDSQEYRDAEARTRPPG